MTALLLAVCILASFRVTRFIVSDSLWEVSRERLIAWCYRRGGPTGEVDALGTARLAPPPVWKAKLGDLIACPWCVGIHVSWIVACLALRAWPWQLGVDGWLFALAIAGGQGALAQFAESA